MKKYQKEFSRLLNGIKDIDYYDQFFYFDTLTIEECYTFLFGDGSDNNDSYRNTSNVLIQFSFHSRLINNDLDDFLSYSKNKNGFIQRFNNKKDIETIRFIVKYVLYYSLKRDNKFESASDINYLLDKRKENNFKFISDRFYYRGQALSNWDLQPSMLRDYKCYPSKGDQVIDLNKLYEIYSEGRLKNSLINKYNMCFPDKKILTATDIDYDFLSWMQHSISFSPLIDFTKDLNVALTFALRVNNPNVFMKEASAVYLLENIEDYMIIRNKEAADDYIRNFKAYYLKSRIKPGSMVVAKDSKGNIKKLDFRSYRSIVKALAPDYRIIDLQQNDRMKNQKGIFVLFSNYVSVIGKIFTKANLKFACIKEVIDPKDKINIYEDINKSNGNIKFNYLMNPYQIFED